MLQDFYLGYPHEELGKALLVQADCMEWLRRVPESSVHGVVTDPPYGVKEYEADQLQKREDGKGGIWRIPPTFDGSNRQPLPRFTALNDKERAQLSRFFTDWASLVVRVLRPGGHVFIACNSFLCQLVYTALVDGGLEFRGQLIRTVRTFRGGDRPKGAEAEFPDVCSLPRGGYEPWGILRKPLPEGTTLASCLKKFDTGGIRRLPEGTPFTDIISSGRTPVEEKLIANHPSLKPQELMRELAWAVLPRGRGIILDPFMGGGSTIAAALAMHFDCIGIERNPDFFEMAKKAVPKLAAIPVARDRRLLSFA